MNPSLLKSELSSAFELRENLNLLAETECVRLFYGPGEASREGVGSFLQHVAIDLYQNQLWITLWKAVPENFLKELRTQLESLTLPEGRTVTGAVLMDRSAVASEKVSTLFFGKPSAERFSCTEYGAHYSIQMLDTKHPGLFLDHAPLRRWLLANQKGKRVLNLFSYTGSLSIAAALGGAKKVTTLDLSQATLDWAKQNWNLNSLGQERGDFIYGDVFEWLPKFKKRNEQFDTVISDPPSFSRSKKGVFSTQKDLTLLHEQLFGVLAPGGTLVTSINSENISEGAFLREIELGARKAQVQFKIIKRVDLPESFPTRDSSLKDRYLKGFYLKRN